MASNVYRSIWHGPNGKMRSRGGLWTFLMATFAHCFVNIGVDLVIIISPIYKVMKLQLFPMRKLGVVLMFALGLV